MTLLEREHHDTQQHAVWWRQLLPTPAAAVIALFVCVVAPAVLVALQIDANPKFSPVDEAAHYDYVNRVAQGEIPRQGQRMLKSTLREVACTGNAVAAIKTAPCDAPVLRYNQFAGDAYQYEALHPPGYHAITAPLRWAMQHVVGVNNRLDATRAVGIVWLAADHSSRRPAASHTMPTARVASSRLFTPTTCCMTHRSGAVMAW